MGFRYENSNDQRLTGTIADLMLRGPAARAAAAERIGEIQARGVQQSAGAWAGAAQNIGEQIGAIPGQMEQRKRQGVSDQLDAAKLRDVQRGEAGNKAVAGLMQGDQLPAGATGPRQDSYLDPKSGLFDVPKMTAALGQAGLGDRAAGLLKGAESINESILKHQELEQKAAAQHSILLGDLADGALKMHATGTPLDAAMDFVVQPALATKRIKPEEYAQVKQQIARLPPEQQVTALKTLMDQAAQLGGGKTLGKDAQEVDRYGRVTATNVVAEPNKGDYTGPDGIRYHADGKPVTGQVMKPAAKRTEAEQEFDAYAKSIGKPNAEALTYADRQVFEKNKETIRSNTAFQQHMRERQYDNANPAPVKEADQGKLEQQYRTVLRGAMSNRSGGIGAEDAKVQQANHLMSLFEQSYNPKTGGYDIPRVQLNELALGLAKLVAGQGPAGEGMLREFQQRTAKGDVAGALTYLTGEPIAANTQAITKYLKDSIERQGKTAEQNREGEMRYLRGLVPTDLEEPRRQALEANSLNPLRQSREIQNKQTGERKLQVSVDGGKTWK